jgi:hypothetical protein
MGKLGQLLVARGWITVQQLTRALKNQGVVGARLGTCLLEMDALSEDLLLKGLSEQLGVPAAAVEDLRGIPEEVRDLLPARLARRCRAIPFRVAGGALDIAMADTRNLGCQDEIAFATGKRVRVHIANEMRLFEALEKYYDEECPARFTHLLDRLNRIRYMWEREAAGEAAGRPAAERAPEPQSGGRGPYDPLAPPLRLEAPPLPEPPPVRAPQAPMAPMAPPVPALAAARSAPLLPVPPVKPTVPAAPMPPAAPAAPAASPAAKPAPVRSISLTDDELQALGRREAEIPEPASLLELQAAFEATHDRDEIGQILLAFLARSYRRAALFQVGRDRVTGWRGRGEGVDGEALARFSTGFDQPSIFLNLRQGNGLYLGPLPPMPVHRELARSWGGELARECVMLPVRLRDRLVTVIYAEGPGLGAGGGLHLEELKRLTNLTAAAFERCILHKKQAGTGA